MIFDITPCSSPKNRENISVCSNCMFDLFKIRQENQKEEASTSERIMFLHIIERTLPDYTCYNDHQKAQDEIQIYVTQMVWTSSSKMLVQASQQNVGYPNTINLSTVEEMAPNLLLFSKLGKLHYLTTNAKINWCCLLIQITCFQHFYPPESTSCGILLTRWSKFLDIINL